MININSNASKIKRNFASRKARFIAGLKKALTVLAVKVDNEQVKNLSGDLNDGAGAYPIPVRTGNLRRGHFFNVSPQLFAIVGNTTSYAKTIHETRPFLDDAVDSVDAVKLVSENLNKTVWAIP